MATRYTEISVGFPFFWKNIIYAYQHIIICICILVFYICHGSSNTLCSCKDTIKRDKSQIYLKISEHEYLFKDITKKDNQREFY